MRNERIEAIMLRPFVLRLGYRHIFLESRECHSMIHVQNPFSFFDPGARHVARARIRLFNQVGEPLGCRQFDIQSFGMLAIDIRDLCIDLRGTSLGTVTVDLQPPRAFRRHLRKLTGGVARIASPFWMRFFDDCGSQAFVHSIEADRMRFHGLPWPLATQGLGKDFGSEWTSCREIRLGATESASAFVVNYSRRPLTTVCTWAANNHDSVTILKLRPREVREVATADGNSGPVFLSMSALATPNAKPYVLVRSESGLFGLTHG